MSDLTDRESALAQLTELAQPESEPEVDDVELDVILSRNQRAQGWVTATALTLGEVVQPTVANGHRYEVTIAGTTGATEPTWPTGDDYTVVNGTVTLQEAGVAYSNVYDVRAAARDVWALKAAKASEYHEEKEQAIHEQCVDKVQQYQIPMIA